ncbi:MAG: hypothetical protein JWP40_4141, partial [Blastococcus sp.]|nr:hypothetical protein [Blastococcus sp.]
FARYADPAGEQPPLSSAPASDQPPAATGRIGAPCPRPRASASGRGRPGHQARRPGTRRRWSWGQICSLDESSERAAMPPCRIVSSLLLSRRRPSSPLACWAGERRDPLPRPGGSRPSTVVPSPQAARTGEGGAGSVNEPDGMTAGHDVVPHYGDGGLGIPSLVRASNQCGTRRGEPVHGRVLCARDNLGEAMQRPLHSVWTQTFAAGCFFPAMAWDRR